MTNRIQAFISSSEDAEIEYVYITYAFTGRGVCWRVKKYTVRKVWGYVMWIPFLSRTIEWYDPWIQGSSRDWKWREKNPFSYNNRIICCRLGSSLQSASASALWLWIWMRMKLKGPGGSSGEMLECKVRPESHSFDSQNNPWTLGISTPLRSLHIQLHTLVMASSSIHVIPPFSFLPLFLIPTAFILSVISRSTDSQSCDFIPNFLISRWPSCTSVSFSWARREERRRWVGPVPRVPWPESLGSSPLNP